MLYHQNILAQVKSGSRRLPASQIFSPAISRFDWRHSHTSARSRKYQPLATAPWPLGSSPVRQGRLHGAGDRRRDRPERTHGALRCQAAQIGRMLPEERRRQPDDENDQCGMHVRYGCRQCWEDERYQPRGPGSDLLNRAGLARGDLNPARSAMPAD